MARLRISIIVVLTAMVALLVPAPAQAVTATIMTLTSPVSVARAAPYTLAGTLLGGLTGTDPIVDVTVTLVRTDLAGSRTIYLKTTSAGFTYTDTPAVGGVVTWKATWPGNVDQTAAAKSSTVKVSRLSPSMSVRTNGTVYNYGTKATVTIHLGTTWNNREVALFATRVYSGKTAFVAKGRVNSAGNFTATYGMSSKTVFTAKFLGDYRYAPTARKVTVNIRPKLAMSTYMSTGRSGSTWYASKTGRISVIATVVPTSIGSCTQWVLQTYSGGAWKTTDGLACSKTNWDSQAVAIITGDGTAERLRIRCTVPATTYRTALTGPWIYVTFV
jgi:hypothetical protein